jgi:hypothetical protein
MPETVTIEGTVTPCVELKRFERATVVMDEHIGNLVRNGHVRIVARHGDPEAELAALADEDITLAPDPGAQVPQPQVGNLPAGDTEASVAP